MVLSFEADVAEVMDTSEKADPLPLSLGEVSEAVPVVPDADVLEDELELFVELTLMTVFIAALLLLKSQTSITESSSPLGVVNVAADKSSPLKGADFGLSRTGSLRLFFFSAANGLGPKRGKKNRVEGLFNSGFFNSDYLTRTIFKLESFSEKELSFY